jgi:16S rRNA processing protein RimM
LTATVGDTPVRLAAGRVGRPHGLDGSFYVTRPRSPLLAVGSTVTVGTRTAAITRRAGTDQRPIVAIEGVSDREAAGRLRGLELTVEQQAAPTLGEGEWWAHELEGCEVFGGARLIGSVRRVLELPSCEALEVQCVGDAGSLLVPMVKDAVRHIDAAERRIEVDVEFLAEALPGDARERGGCEVDRGD